jgi:hypothetical protein
MQVFFSFFQKEQLVGLNTWTNRSSTAHIPKNNSANDTDILKPRHRGLTYEEAGVWHDKKLIPVSSALVLWKSIQKLGLTYVA